MPKKKSSPKKTPPVEEERPVALVTGAGRRVGRAIAEALADDGFDLVIHYRRSRLEAKETACRVRAAGGRAVVFAADLSQAKQAERLARRAQEAFGRVDVLLNSAAVFRASPPEKLTAADLDFHFAVNLKAPYLLSAALAPSMKARGGGLIVNLDCVSAGDPWPGFIPYSVSKAALRSLTVGLAKAFAPEVRVNGIAPGTVLPDDGASPAELRRWANSMLLKRLGSPADVVRAVRYLIQAEFVTGEILHVDGGRRWRGSREG